MKGNRMAIDIQREAGSGIEVSERGKDAQGNTLMLDRRLFMQLLAFGNCPDPGRIVDMLAEKAPAGVLALYLDLNDPYGLGLLTGHEDPDFFVTGLRELLHTPPFRELSPKPALTMFGRTYSIGYETDLESTLLTRPVEKVTNLDLPWAIWYPLRRAGAFERLSADEQRTVLMEHGGIGRAYGRAGLGTDIRLASHGLDVNDNDFTVALLGPELAPLSKIVERMRKTKQTSLYLQSLGPFFIGKALWQKRS
jgi:chlorite dismutase